MTPSATSPALISEIFPPGGKTLVPESNVAVGEGELGLLHIGDERTEETTDREHGNLKGGVLALGALLDSLRRSRALVYLLPETRTKSEE